MEFAVAEVLEVVSPLDRVLLLSISSANTTTFRIDGLRYYTGTAPSIR